MSEVDDILKEYGVETSLPAVEGGAGFQMYQHEVGQYRGLVGKVKPVFKNLEGKKCEASVAGAKLTGLNLPIIVLGKIKDGVMEKYIENGVIPENEPYGKFLYNIHFSMLGEDQWKYKKTFESFFVNDDGKLTILKTTSTDGKVYKIHYNLLSAYQGAPVVFDLIKSKKDSIYLESLTLIDHEISVDIFNKRKATMEDLLSKLSFKLEDEKSKRKSNNVSVESIDSSSSIDSILGGDDLAEFA